MVPDKVLGDMTNRERKSIIEQWVTEINPKAVLRAADARCGARYAEYVVETWRVRNTMHRLPAAKPSGTIPSWGILCQ